MSLAIMQEEVLETSAKMYSRRPSREYSKFSNKTMMPNDKGILGTTQLLGLKLQ
jgi:hypothetical protein